MTLILVIDPGSGGTARVLAPIQRSGFPYELFRDADTALRHMVDPLFPPMAHVIVIAPAAAEEQRRLLAGIAARRPEIGYRVVLLTERAAAGHLADLAERLRVHAVLAVPFGVEELADAIGSCAVSDRPRRLVAASRPEPRAASSWGW